jgi:EF hand
MIVRNRMVVGRSGAVVGLGLAISLGLINAAAAQGPTELNLGPGYRLPLMPPSPTPAILPATQYLVGQLRAGMTLEMYLRRLRGEFQLADADADGEVSESDAAVHAQFEVANYRSRLLLEIMSNDLNGDGVVTEEEIRRTAQYQRRYAVAPPGMLEADIIESGVRWLMAADTNHDGRITFDEAEAYAVARANSVRPNSWRVQQLLMLAPPGKTVVTFADVQTAAEAVFHSQEEAQARKEAEAAQQRADAKRTGEEARAQREAAAAQQRAEARHRAEESRAKQETEQRAACAMPKASEAAKVVVISGYETEALSSVAIGSQNAPMRTGTIEVEPGKDPIYLVAVLFDPVIWRLKGAVERIEGLVLTTSRAETVDGRLQDKPLGKCMNSFVEMPSSGAAATLAAISREVGKEAATVAVQYSFSDVSVPSGNMHSLRGADAKKVMVIQQSTGGLKVEGSSDNVVIYAAAQDPETSLKRYSPGGVETIDPGEVVAPLPVEKYEVLPEEAGLVQLLHEGKIAQNRSGEYLIKQKIRFPSGLYGGHGVEFLLLKGVPRPDGDPGHSKVISEETGEAVSFGK